MQKWIFPGLLFGLLTFFLSSCVNDPEEVRAFVSRFDTQVERAEGVEILYSDSAILKVRVEGPTMLTYLDRSDPRQEFPDGVQVDFFSPDEKISSTLTAKYAIRHENKSEVFVRDSVVWRSAKGEKLETEELIWDERKEKVYSNKFVVITRPGEIIYGHGFEANQDFSYSRINAIEGRLKVEDLEENPR